MSGVEKISQDISSALPLEAPDDSVSLTLQNGTVIQGWTGYEFNCDWTEACSQWNASLADGNYQVLLPMLQNGTEVRFSVNGRLQATGYVDRVVISSTRGGGTLMTVSGRDKLGPAVDSCMDTKFNFNNDKSILDIVAAVMTPFGFPKESIVVDDRINVSAITGLTSEVLGENSQDNSSIANVLINKRFRPTIGEGCYAFLERLGKRCGFHIWCSADGKTLFCGQPTYDQKAVGTLTHGPNAVVKNSNVLSSDVRYDWTQQPAVIFATNFGSADHHRYAPLRVMVTNEFIVDATEPEVLTSLRKLYVDGTYVVPRRTYVKRRPEVVPTTKFITLVVVHDDESRTRNQLIHFARAEMCKHQSKFLTATYTVKGHSIPSAEGRSIKSNDPIWAPNTMVRVNDTVSGLVENMWIKSRTFKKDRHAGTTTTLELILPYSMELFPAGEGTDKETQSSLNQPGVPFGLVNLSGLGVLQGNTIPAVTDSAFGSNEGNRK